MLEILTFLLVFKKLLPVSIHIWPSNWEAKRKRRKKCQCHLHKQQCEDWMCFQQHNVHAIVSVCQLRCEGRTVHPHHWWSPHYYPLEPYNAWLFPGKKYCLLIYDIFVMMWPNFVGKEVNHSRLKRRRKKCTIQICWTGLIASLNGVCSFSISYPITFAVVDGWLIMYHKLCEWCLHANMHVWWWMLRLHQMLLASVVEAIARNK